MPELMRICWAEEDCEACEVVVEVTKVFLGKISVREPPSRESAIWILVSLVLRLMKVDRGGKGGVAIVGGRLSKMKLRAGGMREEEGYLDDTTHRESRNLMVV